MRWSLEKVNTFLSIVTYLIGIIGSIGIVITFLLHYFYPNKKDYDFIKFAIVISIFIILFLALLLIIKHIVSLQIKLKLSHITIEGIQISALGNANSLRKYNKDYKIHQVTHEVTIDGTALIQDYTLAGIKHKNIHNNNSFDFSLDVDTNLLLSELDCYAYDLKHDPIQSRKIYPILKSTDGQSKKIQVNFLSEIRRNSDFKIFLHTNIPDCMKKGKDYYISSLSFDGKEKVDTLSLRFTFKNQLPNNLRVYELLKNGSVREIKTLTPDFITSNEAIFNDRYTDTDSIKYLVYIFDRSF